MDSSLIQISERLDYAGARKKTPLVTQSTVPKKMATGTFTLLAHENPKITNENAQ